MTLRPLGKPHVSEDMINDLCDDDVGRYVRCMRILRRLLEIGGPHRYVSSHELPRGLKTLGLGFVDNGEWYELGCLKARAVSNARTLVIEVEWARKDEVFKKLDGFCRAGNV